MPLRTEETVINGVPYAVSQLPATTGIKYQAKLSKILLPALATAVGAISEQDGKSILDSKFDGKLLGEAAQLLVDGLDQDGILDLVLGLLSQTVRDGKPITREVFNDSYSGNYVELYQALWFTITVNRFFPIADDIGSLWSRWETMATAKKTPGSPGDSPKN